MNAAAISGQMLAVGERAARRAVTAKQTALIADAATEFPEVSATVTAAGVSLAAPGLRARAFGTRSTPRDLRLITFVEDHR